MKKFLRNLFLFLILAVLAVGGFYYWRSSQQADRLEETQPLSELVAQEMSRPDYVAYDQIPEFMKEATIAVEDARFYEHSGLDWLGLARGFISQFVPSMEKSGGSSITQQVVKNLYAQFDASLEWKGTEMIQALRLEKLLSKDEILALYMNIINYGDQHEGIYSASTGYFNVEPYALNEQECAILAGIPQSPNNLQLSDHFEAAKRKQKTVLEAMVRNNMIDQTLADDIYARPIYYLVNGVWISN